MKPTLPLFTTLLLPPLAALQAVDKAANPEISRFQSIGPNDGAPAIATDGPPKLIPNPSATEVYSRAKRTCTGVPSLAITPGGRLWVAWYSGTTQDAKIESCPNAYVVVSTSGDGGKTWNEVLVIDPDAQQTADGTIYLTLDFQRSSEQEILLTSFTEGAVLCTAEETVARVKSARRLVSKGRVQ